jgi:hypothetical protein
MMIINSNIEQQQTMTTEILHNTTHYIHITENTHAATMKGGAARFKIIIIIGGTR